MTDETMHLLKAYIEATGYDVKTTEVCGIRYGRTEYVVTKKKSKPRETKQEGYTDGFEHLWAYYGKVGNKSATFRQYNARMSGCTESWHIEYDKMEKGIQHYNMLIDATDQFKKNMETFLGRDKHYLNDFTIPAQAIKQNQPKLPYGDNELESFAEKHKLRMARPGESSGAYRKYLQLEINQLSE